MEKKSNKDNNKVILRVVIIIGMIELEGVVVRIGICLEGIIKVNSYVYIIV